MKIKTLEKILETYNISEIEFEDRRGNTIGFLSEFCMADIEVIKGEKGGMLRLQKA